MGVVCNSFNRFVAPVCAAVTVSLCAVTGAALTAGPAAAQGVAPAAPEPSAPIPKAGQGRLDSLFAQLQTTDPAEARRIAREIALEWSKSGSPAMDLLLQRGQQALRGGDIDAAIGHLTALTDHAPDFAEGFHTRAIAYAGARLYGPALADIARALTLQPRHFQAMFSLGALMEELGQPDLALQAFRNVRAIHPHHEGVTAAIERVTRELGGARL